MVYFSLKASNVRNLEDVSSRRLLTLVTSATNQLLQKKGLLLMRMEELYHIGMLEDIIIIIIIIITKRLLDGTKLPQVPYYRGPQFLEWRHPRVLISYLRKVPLHRDFLEKNL